METYIRDNELTFPVIMDTDGQLARDFGLKGMPVTLVLSSGGDISFVETGYTTGMGLRLRMWLSTMLSVILIDVNISSSIR